MKATMEPSECWDPEVDVDVDVASVLGLKNKKRALIGEDMNCVTYRIFLDEFHKMASSPYENGHVVEVDADKSLQAYRYCLDQCLQFIEPLTVDYLWHVEPFNLQLQYLFCSSSFNDRTTATRSTNRKQQQQRGFLCLEGSTRFGENVMDEWFIVFLLREISKKWEALTITVTDNDGQFLLIEGAEFLPEWISSPAKSANRVFLKQGLLHLIPVSLFRVMSSTSTSVSKSLRQMKAIELQENRHLMDALNVLLLRQGECIGSKMLQKAVWGRRVTQQPSMAKTENSHKTICILPHRVASVFAKYPDLVVKSARAFLYRDDTDIKAINRMKFLDVQHELNAVNMCIRFTRCSYAQLFCQPLTPTKPFKTWIKNCNNEKLKECFEALLENESDQLNVNDVLSFREKALLMGLKLSCGLEIYCTNPIWNSNLTSKSVPQPASVNINTDNTDDKLLRLFLNYPTKLKCDTACDIAGIKSVITAPMQVQETKDMLKQQLELGNSSLSSFSSVAEDLIVPNTILSLDMDRNYDENNDDDSWLNVTAEGLASVLDSTAESLATQNVFQGMFENVSKFMDAESGLDGVQIRSSNSSESNLNVPRNHELMGTTEKMKPANSSISFDPDKLMNLLSNMDLTSDEEEEGDYNSLENGLREGEIEVSDFVEAMDDELEQHKNIGKTVQEIGNQVHDGNEMKQNNSVQGEETEANTKPSNTDSDGRSASELQKELNLNFTVVKNLVESFEAQLGQPGPASTLLTELGRSERKSKMEDKIDSMSDAEKEMVTEESEDGITGKNVMKGRLLISKLVLENFKSYAGVKEIGPFHKCFSAVVGPNGSGKSNVIDAMLFVFGKRAKKLRLNKVSQLIHNSNEHPNKEFAKVSVHFQNIIDTVEENDVDGDNNTYKVVPESEVVVSRIAYKNNKSEYFIDGKKSTFGGVSKLLEARGIDLHNNRFLILQGEVEQISLMKPKAQTEHEDGLLEYLEDIIGSNKYVEEIEERSKVIEELSQVRTEKLNRVKVVEKEKDNLEDAKNEAMQYMTTERHLSCLKSKEYQVFKLEAVAKQNVLTEKKQILEEKLRKIKEKGSDRRTKVDEKEDEYKKAVKEKEELTSELNKCKKSYTSFERKDIKHREDIKHVIASIKKLKVTVEKENKKEEKHEKAHVKAEQSIPNLEEILKGKEKLKEEENGKLESMYATLKDKTEPLRLQLETKQRELAPFTKSKADCQNELDLVNTEIEIVEKSTTEAMQKVENSKQELKETELKLKSLPQDIKTCELELKELKIELEDNIKTIADLVGHEQKLEQVVRDGRSRVESAKASLAMASSKSALLQSLEHARQKGKLKDAGLHGRLGDLGYIDPKYDIAVSTACGALDYLVTDTTSGAEQCVNFLRDRKLGRATFAILEKFKHLETQMNKSIKTPENVPRLFDLIQPMDEKYKSAFYFALRDTLVVNTLDEAARIAYNGNKCEWRVVTLKGQLIDKAGTMSGGGTRVKKGRMLLNGGIAQHKSRLGEDGGGMTIADLSMTKEETEKLELSISTSSEELKKIREKKRGLKSDQSKLEKNIEKRENELEKKTLMIRSLEHQLTQIQERIKLYEPKCKFSEADSEKLEKLRKTAQKHEKLLDVAKQKAKTLEDVCEELQKEIMNAGGEPLRKQKAKVEEVAKECEYASKELSKAKLDCKGLLKKVQKARKTYEEANEELQQLEKKKVQLEESFKTIEDGALEVIQALEKVKVLEQDMSAKVSDLKKEYTQMRTEQNKFDKELVDVENEIDICCDDLAKAEERVSTWTKKEMENKKRFQVYLPHVGDIENEIKNNKERKNVIENESPDGNNSDDSDSEDSEGISNKESEFMSLPELTMEESKDIDRDELRNMINSLGKEVDVMKKNVNMGAIDEYLKREGEYNVMVQDLEGATKRRDEARNACESLRKKRLDDFMSGFSIITLKLKEMYQMITMGGDAELELVDSLDPFSEGIVFSVRPPKKSWKNISNLSGGEKTLSSLALVFALHHYNPTPLYVMDEIDAALDYKNVSIVANYIKERTKNAQFIIISLRNNMFELADRLVGIYKTDNATKSITINPAKIMKKQHLTTKDSKQDNILEDCTNVNVN